MPIDLYYSPASSASRAVLLAAKSIGVDLNLNEIDIFQREHITAKHLKEDPHYQIPCIDDNGFIVNESRAIMAYLQSQYGKNDSLYPHDPKKRAVVDSRLYFDMDLYARFHEVYTRETFAGAPPNPQNLKRANEALEFLDTILGQTKYAAGDNLTLADLTLVVEISNLDALKHDLSIYKNINKWYAKVKAEVPGYKEANEDHLVLIKQIAENFSKGQ